MYRRDSRSLGDTQKPFAIHVISEGLDVAFLMERFQEALYQRVTV
jgi:hypothetical protein